MLTPPPLIPLSFYIQSYERQPLLMAFSHPRTKIIPVFLLRPRDPESLPPPRSPFLCDDGGDGFFRSFSRVPYLFFFRLSQLGAYRVRFSTSRSALVDEEASSRCPRPMPGFRFHNCSARFFLSSSAFFGSRAESVPLLLFPRLFPPIS